MNDTHVIKNLTSLAKHLRPYFTSNSEIVAVYVFGSRAKGTETIGSDIDIAILLSPDFDLKTHPIYRLEQITQLEMRLSTPVDVVILNQASLVLCNQVLKYGKLIYEANHQQRITFEVRSMQTYHDFEPAMAYLNRSLTRQIQEVGLVHRYRGHYDPLSDARRALERFEHAANRHNK